MFVCLCVLGEPGVSEPQELDLQAGAEKQCMLLKCEGGGVDTGSLSTQPIRGFLCGWECMQLRGRQSVCLVNKMPCNYKQLQK